MDLRKKLLDLSLESKGLYYRLSIIFSLFFFVPLLGLLYFGLEYNLLDDRIPAPYSSSPCLALRLRDTS